MGYMGFGMQKWIYSRNPRKKLFVKERIPLFNPLQSYYKEYSIKPNFIENIKINGFLVFLIGMGFIIVSTIIFTEFSNYSNIHSKEMMEMRIYKNDKAYNFLINSGKERLKTDNVLGAYSEFKLACNIYPKREELQQLIAETLSILCERNQKYCNELDDFLNKGIE